MCGVGVCVSVVEACERCVWQVQQQCLTREHVESFKQQMVDVIRCAKENPDIVKQLSGAVDDDDCGGLIASSLSDMMDGATHMSVSVDVTRVGGTQPIPITLSMPAAAPVAASDRGISPPHLDNVTVTAGGLQPSALAPLSDAHKPGGSSSTELSSDAEYYTPVGSPDESAGNTVVHLDELSAASELTAAFVSKVGDQLLLVSELCFLFR